MAEAMPELRQGDTGEAVVELQRALDVPWLKDDGIFGPVTRHLVRAYRVSKGLPDENVVDAAVWEMLGVDDYA